LGFFCRRCAIIMVVAGFIAIKGSLYCAAWTNESQYYGFGNVRAWRQASYLPRDLTMPPRLSPPPAACMPNTDYLVKMAYGRTFGTSTLLDYATLEFSKSLRKFPAQTHWGPAIGEVQVALLGSYVFYNQGTIERVKKLQFENGFELAWIPKGRFTFPPGPAGMSSYIESGAGMSYVSETFLNSGSRWNWSLLAGFGFERCLPGNGIVSIGVQWRHLSNGNMWGTGSELHNSNSGTDMIQGLASILHRF